MTIAWIAASTLTWMGMGQGAPSFGGVNLGQAVPKMPLGNVIKAGSPSETTLRTELMNSANLKKAISWQTVGTLGPDRIRFGNNYLIFYKPSCVDAGGLADLLGMPGGWHSEPGDDQSYLLTNLSTAAGRRYGLVYEIWRYQDDSGPAAYSLTGPAGAKTRNLAGSGFFTYTFVAPETGRAAVMLRMASKGRYLFRKVEIRLANL